MDETQDYSNEIGWLIDLTFTKKAYMNVTGEHWIPHVDIYEKADEILVYVELPGVEKTDINLTYSDGYLVIAGYRRELCPDCLTKLHRMEMDAGRFWRKIQILADIIQDTIEAEYRNGILEIKLPKRG